MRTEKNNYYLPLFLDSKPKIKTFSHIISEKDNGLSIIF